MLASKYSAAIVSLQQLFAMIGAVNISLVIDRLVIHATVKVFVKIAFIVAVVFFRDGGGGEVGAGATSDAAEEIKLKMG